MGYTLHGHVFMMIGLASHQEFTNTHEQSNTRNNQEIKMTLTNSERQPTTSC